MFSLNYGIEPFTMRKQLPPMSQIKVSVCSLLIQDNLFRKIVMEQNQRKNCSKTIVFLQEKYSFCLTYLVPNTILIWYERERISCFSA